MWRRPPAQIEAVLRAWVGVVVLLAGFSAMRLMLYGLKDSTSSLLALVCAVLHLALIVVGVWAPFRSLRQRYARKLADRLPAGPKHLVSLSLSKGKRAVLSDVGVLALRQGCLRFEGLGAAFVLPRARLRTKPGANLTLYVRIQGIRYRFTLQELEKLGEVEQRRPLEDALARFWSSPSGDETVEPPTEPHPKPWSGKHFPGFSLVIFWSIVNIALIAQSLVFQYRGQLDAQRGIAFTYFATLCVASVFAIARLALSSREAARRISDFCPPVLSAPEVRPTEPLEVQHVRA